MSRVCGNCKYHGYLNAQDGYVCVNEDSEYFSDWTDNECGCMDWEQEEE